MKTNEPLIIHSREKDLGGFSVHRCLPNIKKRSVGPFVFLDHMGPMTIDETHALDVRPHPHIGLSTVTYLLEGRALHRDSLGSIQEITPGDLNWMTAGKGIVHSERTPVEDRDPQAPKSVHGIQLWVGLPKELEQCEPSFTHWAKENFPSFKLAENISVNLMLGQYEKYQSPVPTFWKALFMDIDIRSNAESTFSFSEKEIAIGVISGSVNVDGFNVQANDLIVVGNPSQVKIKTENSARLIVIGGEPFPEPRIIWWNFVSSDKNLIKDAIEKWKNQTMGKVEGEHDYAPLSSDPLP